MYRLSANKKGRRLSCSVNAMLNIDSILSQHSTKDP